jgi:hypothetical protein
MGIVVLGHGRRYNTKEVFTLSSLYTFDLSDQMESLQRDKDNGEA